MSIKVKKLVKYFGETKAVDDISFEVKKGEIMGFLGPNGAGKSTTIRCIMDSLKYDSGSISVFGKDTVAHSEALKKNIGFLSGDVRLYRDWTGAEHIKYVEQLLNAKHDSAMISRLDFDVRKRVKNLSTGNKQKLGIILALIGNPKLLLLDEPTNSLDPLLQIEVYNILKEKADQGTTIFMSSHVLSEVEKVCDRVCILREGKIAAIEKVSDLKQKRIYQVTIAFDENVNRQDLESKSITIEKQTDHTYVLKVKGNISELISKISKFKLKDIEISESHLEEIFLEYYK